MRWGWEEGGGESVYIIRFCWSHGKWVKDECPPRTRFGLLRRESQVEVFPFPVRRNHLEAMKTPAKRIQRDQQAKEKQKLEENVPPTSQLCFPTCTVESSETLKKSASSKEKQAGKVISGPRRSSNCSAALPLLLSPFSAPAPLPVNRSTQK